ncbi:pirin family protein [Janthinobacterium agaricidamnosum]|uniref:Pirin C-terminal cupin domain protein n=1 Tax=Janthinobacterium agaricidamnosum NBRC 102515 = DSM 9628 TaxID=1349767 RepID=W0V4T2_9BURK|nr:pirin family protein [Janthinobacterium agaricidamnosum]CDG82600.1 pirin C-terminal cupin domain protein [Janthinobacterium agaricidamnosum NBRC 102515 = DSM 9628]
MDNTTVKHGRGVERVIAGQAVMDGAGVKINRVLTQSLQRRLDPFLMLDNFASDQPNDYIAGFPDHPHRGFETVSYMISGRMRHKDSAGNEGLLNSGGVQWMTAGSGVIHSEMPEQEQGVMEGFQLWLNLPARDKMRKPWYRDFSNAEIPRFSTDAGVTVQVIAGSSHGVAGAVQREVTEPVYLDIDLPAGTSFSQQLPPGHNAFIYTFRGAVSVDDKAVPALRMAILANTPGSDGVEIHAAEASRVILVAGQPLNEPIAQYGPFVMNTQAEIVEAVQDFRDGRFGEHA